MGQSKDLKDRVRGKVANYRFAINTEEDSSTYLEPFSELENKLVDEIVSLIHQSNLDSRIEEMQNLMTHSKELPGVYFKYPEDEEKYREFSRASVIIAKYADYRLEALKAEQTKLNRGEK